MSSLTTTGRGVLAGSLLVWLAAWTFGYEELAVVAATGLLAVAVAVAWTGTRPRLSVTRELLPDRVARGEVTVVEAMVDNHRRRPTASALGIDRVGGREIEVVVPGVAAAGTARLSYELPTDRRGVLTVGPLELVREDPLGLVRRVRSIGGTATLWVYPKTHAVQVVPAGRTRDLEGPTSDTASGSITFHALREYVTGDDLRLVHWRSTARTGTLMVRHQSDPSRPRCDVVLDNSRSSYPDPDGFEAAVEAAASVVLALTARRFPVTLRTTDGMVVTSSRGRSAAQTFLDRLAAIELVDDGGLAAAAVGIATGRRGNALVVLTGEPVPEHLHAVESLRHRFDVMIAGRFRPGSEPSANLDHGVLELVVPDGESFAHLWNLRVAR